MKYFPVEVRFADIDAFGHVNNATFLSLVEHARVLFYDTLYKVTKPLDFPFVLVHASIDYKKPVLIMDPLEIGVAVGQIGRSSWDFLYEMRNKETKEIYANVKTTQVYYSHEKSAPARLPAELREKLEAHTA